MEKDSSHYLDSQFSDSFGAARLSIAVIGPDEGQRFAVAKAFAECQQGGDVREFASYPPGLDDVPRLLEAHYDVIIIELDSNPEYALELVEGICANGVASVMVYSENSDSEMLVRCMRAGAREFLTLPIARSTMAEALVRAAARRPANRPAKRGTGKLLVFFGAKGGAGVTILACNFAVALAQDTSQRTLFIDLDLPLGDAALNLGLEAEYSTINALQESGRLDASFLSKLLVKHSSGLYVLPAPGKLPQYPATDESIDRLITVARQEFDNVVVDVGSRLDFAGTTLFKDAKTIYLVTQAGIPELRNSNRLISQFFSSGGPNLEVVINRFQPRALGVGDEHIAKALTRAPQWQIPNDYAAVRQMQNTATPLVLEDSPIARLIREMAGTVTGHPVLQEKKKGFSFRSLGRGNAKGGASEETQGFPRVTPSPSAGGGAFSPNPPDARSSALEPLVFAPSARKPVLPGIRPLTGSSAPLNTADRAGGADSNRELVETAVTPALQSEPETRTYKGVTYVKGPDGQWHVKTEGKSSVPEELPAITWLAPAPIAYGTPLDKTQFNATAPTAGRFVYTPAEGYVLPAGTHTLWVTFTPLDGPSERRAQASVPLTVTKAKPTASWAEPEAISCGVALGAAQLNATASIPGTFVYKPAGGELLDEGTHTLSAIFTPADAANYSTAEASVTITVTRETPVVTWAAPVPVPYGTPLGVAQLNATASVPGTFTYTPGAGDILSAGTHTLSASFAPKDTAGCRMGQASVSLTVTKTTPILNWEKPAPITYGAALSPAQLNATASVEGKFVYIPAAGAVLAAGAHTPSVIFTPADTANYTPVRASVPLTVTKATPVITWPTPASIAFGTALGASELNATASVPGTFVYTPAAGALLEEGKQTLSAVFTPADAADYTTAEASVSLTVTKATPILIWPAPAPITYGVALCSAHLNATASVPGTFVYTPAAGEVLEAGAHTLFVAFTPAGAADYTAAEATVPLTVTKSAPAITWPAPAPIAYGEALGTGQLNATASVPGTFVYTPDAGEVLGAGKQMLSATFTPADFANYTVAEAAVPLAVGKAEPEIKWAVPTDITYGTPLGAAELNAAASVPGTFVYTPSAGTVLPAGTQTLLAIFTPADAANYTAARASVPLVVDDGLSSMAPATPAGPDPDVEDLFPTLRADAWGIPAEKSEMERKIPPAVKAPSAPAQTVFRSFRPLDAAQERAGLADNKRGAVESAGAPNRRGEPETRIYKGATYVKGADGQWHVKQR